MAGFEGEGVHLAQLEEGQYLKQLDDLTTDLTNSLDSALTTCNTLKVRHAKFRTYLEEDSPQAAQGSGRCLDIVAEGF